MRWSSKSNRYEHTVTISLDISDGTQAALPEWIKEGIEEKDAEKTTKKIKRHTTFGRVLPQGNCGADRKIHGRRDAGLHRRNPALPRQDEAAGTPEDGKVNESNCQRARSEPCHHQQMNDRKGHWHGKLAGGCTQRQGDECR